MGSQSEVVSFVDNIKIYTDDMLQFLMVSYPSSNKPAAIAL